MAPSKCDINGVDYEKGYLQTMDQVSTKMAGALGFKDTGQLWDLYLKDPATKPILTSWLDIRKKTFGAKLKHAHMTIRPAVINRAFDPKMQPIISSTRQPRIGRDGVDEKSLAPMTCLWMAWKLIKASPGLFRRSQLDTKPPHVDPYDITHAYKLLSWIYRKQMGGKIPTTRPRNTAVEPPVFFHEGLGATTAAGPSRSVRDLFGVSSGDAAKAMENERAVAVAIRDEDAARTLKLDVVGELADAIYNESNPGGQIGGGRTPCLPIDRANLLRHLMEIDCFQHDCILSETTHDLPGNGGSGIGAPREVALSVAATENALSNGEHPNVSTNEIPSNEETPVSTMDESPKGTELKAAPLSPTPALPSLNLESLLENPTMVGPDVPPRQITTVELVNPDRIQAMYNERYEVLLREFQPNADPTQYTSADPGSGSHAHRCALRRLCLLAFSPRLDKFVSRINAKHDLTTQMKDHAEKDDRGFALYYANTALDLSVPMPSTPLLQGSYLAMDTPKLRILLKILHDEDIFDTTTAVAARSRIIIVAHWPLILWVTEMFLNSLSIPFVTIRPSMSAKDRRKAITCFTTSSPKRACQVLLTNFNCGAKTMNLHTRCSRMVVMEPPLSMKRLFHAIGGIHRVGQKERQKVWILYQDQTFSRWMEANSTLNALPWVAAKMEKEQQGEGEGSESSGSKGKGNRRAGYEGAEAELTRLFGRPCDFSSFINYCDLGDGLAVSVPAKRASGERIKPGRAKRAKKQRSKEDAEV